MLQYLRLFIEHSELMRTFLGTTRTINSQIAAICVRFNVYSASATL